jgi:hypothetical protein
MRVSKRYANRRVSDVSEEIQQQSSSLDTLEKRLDMAQTLCEQVDHLHKLHEVETLESINKDLVLTGAYLSHLVAMLC